MNLSDRLDAFVRLGKTLRELPVAKVATQANRDNGWFTEDNVRLALLGITEMLNPTKLSTWISEYHEATTPKTVGVAMAGNIPLVGFHDMLCVLMSGHRLIYKPSSKDMALPRMVCQMLCSLEPRFSGMIEQSERLKGVDALIATGSDNTSRYFDYYFRNVPHIIRRNRVSCAVLQGDEPAFEIEALGNDIFSYYGLGCRNVSFLWIPRDYALDEFIERLAPFEKVAEHHKYHNNYTYQKTLLLLNREQFMDSGFFLLRKSEVMVSPVAVLHYRVYNDLNELRNRIREQTGRLQVIVSAKGWYEGSIPFGTAQFPAVTDYADGVDTMRFLSEL
jgi:hypothetical protein